jgi:ornithine carbamoyltransferase
MANATRHFLTLEDLSKQELLDLLDRAIELKSAHYAGETYRPLLGKTLSMIFAKSSTRTRVSFETAMNQMGGAAINLTADTSQIGRGEPLIDTARVLSRMVDAIMIRTEQHSDVVEIAQASTIPVINGLTDDFHPCQLLADLQTFIEARDTLNGAQVAWIGDGNNVCHSFINASRLLGFNLNIATPKGYEPSADVVTIDPSFCQLGNDPIAAAHKADLVVTDTWASMGQESERAQRLKDFEGFCVDSQLMQHANKDALFMHCLPAYRGFEVSEEVFEGPQSMVFQEAENRLHAQKALLEKLLVPNH